MDDRNKSLMNLIFIGEVASVQNYGAFISIPSSSSQGLVHRTQMSKVTVPDASEVLSRGDKVWCKVISISDDGKIGLSMKAVDQGNGKDLDPNGVQLKLDEQRRKEWTPNTKRKTITLDAVFNTTCSKCGTKGHLSKNCFQVAGGKTYELLPDIEDITTEPRTTSSPHGTSEEERKQKKDKKKAKKKKKSKKKHQKEAKKASKRRESTSSSFSEDSSESFKAQSLPLKRESDVRSKLSYQAKEPCRVVKESTSLVKQMDTGTSQSELSHSSEKRSRTRSRSPHLSYKRSARKSKSPQSRYSMHDLKKNSPGHSRQPRRRSRSPAKWK